MAEKERVKYCMDEKPERREIVVKGSVVVVTKRWASLRREAWISFETVVLSVSRKALSTTVCERFTYRYTSQADRRLLTLELMNTRASDIHEGRDLIGNVSVEDLGISCLGDIRIVFFTLLPFIISVSVCAALSPIPWALGSILEMLGEEKEQSISSLSTPKTATSEGT